jgi:hypothetical protein
MRDIGAESHFAEEDFVTGGGDVNIYQSEGVDGEAGA